MKRLQNILVKLRNYKGTIIVCALVITLILAKVFTMPRNKILRTAELAGSTIKIGDKRHYLLADIALIGEAIMLAMRTNVKIISQQILY